MKKTVVIVVYSDTPSDLELASFLHCISTLNMHKIHIVAPKTLSLSAYVPATSKNSINCTVIRLDDTWFQSIQTYNQLMLSKTFYDTFIDYDYILLYQLDAWVFYDALDEWCAKGYDYIGAPWFSDRGELFPYAGNGGFSLRKVSAFQEILQKKNYPSHAWDSSFLAIAHPAKTPFRAKVKKILHYVSMFFCRLSPRLFIKYNRDFEDITFSKAFSFTGSKRVAPPLIAAYFSFERFPEKLYCITGQKLPFGCHAFAKHNKHFWARWIPCLRDSPKN